MICSCIGVDLRVTMVNSSFDDVAVAFDTEEELGFVDEEEGTLSLRFFSLVFFFVFVLVMLMLYSMMDSIPND